MKSRISIANNRKAFTIVELAVVIVVAGLLIGGTLTGITLMKSAKVTATIAQITNYRAAVDLFKKTYGSMPGDMLGADTRLPNCKAFGSFKGCNPVNSFIYTCADTSTPAKIERCTQCPAENFADDSSVCVDFCYYSYSLAFDLGLICGYDQACFDQFLIDTCIPGNANVFTRDQLYSKILAAGPAYPLGQIEDGAIGPISWDMLSYMGQYIYETDLNADNAVEAEPMLFWYELLQAGLISGVTDAGLQAATNYAAFGKTEPMAELGGGFWVAHSDGCCGVRKESGYDPSKDVDTGRPYAAGPFTLNGNILVLTLASQGSREQVSGKKVYKCSYVNGVYSCTYKQSEKWMLNNDDKDNVISPIDAEEIDRKLDDGVPNTGTIQPYGRSETCYKPDGSGWRYDRLISDKNCGLYIKLN